MSRTLSPHLKRLEAESIGIIREVAAEFANPVMLYSIGKDSGVMLHLALKAFYPSKLPFPLLHVDTTWKFKDMISFRDEIAKRYGLDLIVQGVQIAQGNRKDVDWAKTGQATLDGAIGGAISGGIGFGAGKIPGVGDAAATPLGNMFKGMARDGVSEAVSGVAGTVATSAIHASSLPAIETIAAPPLYDVSLTGPCRPASSTRMM